MDKKQNTPNSDKRNQGLSQWNNSWQNNENIGGKNNARGNQGRGRRFWNNSKSQCQIYNKFGHITRKCDSLYNPNFQK